MNKNHSDRKWAILAGFVPIALACSLLSNAVPAATPTPAVFVLPTGIPARVEVVTATNPPEPTAEITLIPAPSLEVPPTGASSPVAADVKDYYGKGYLPFENGRLYTLDDFSEMRPSIKTFDFTRTGKQSQDFALWADIELDTTGTTSYPEYTGCGFAYRVQNNNEGYTAILTNEAVRMGHCAEGLSQCELFGTTYGTGTVDVRDGTKARFSMAVNRDHAYVLVNGILAGKYTLFTTKLLGMGDLYYGVVSNINNGYWTSCKISNIQFWESIP